MMGPYKVEIWAYPVAPDGDWRGVVHPCASVDDPAAKSFDVIHQGGRGSNLRLRFTDKFTTQTVATHLFRAYDQGRGDALDNVKEALGL